MPKATPVACSCRKYAEAGWLVQCPACGATDRRLIPFTLPGGVCEMGDEDGCPNVAAYWLVAPASYVVPMQVCLTHMEDERHYFDTKVAS